MFAQFRCNNLTCYNAVYWRERHWVLKWQPWVNVWVDGENVWVDGENVQFDGKWVHKASHVAGGLPGSVCAHFHCKQLSSVWHFDEPAVFLFSFLGFIVFANLNTVHIWSLSTWSCPVVAVCSYVLTGAFICFSNYWHSHAVTYTSEFACLWTQMNTHIRGCPGLLGDVDAWAYSVTWMPTSYLNTKWYALPPTLHCSGCIYHTDIFERNVIETYVWEECHIDVRLRGMLYVWEECYTD